MGNIELVLEKLVLKLKLSGEYPTDNILYVLSLYKDEYEFVREYLNKLCRKTELLKL